MARTFNATANASGQLVIQFTKGTVDNPKVCAIGVAEGYYARRQFDAREADALEEWRLRLGDVADVQATFVSAWAADNAMQYIDSENLEGGMQAWHGAMPTGFRASPKHEQAAAILPRLKGRKHLVLGRILLAEPDAAAAGDGAGGGLGLRSWIQRSREGADDRQADTRTVPEGWKGDVPTF